MRPEHIEFRIEQQLNTMDFIKDAVKNLLKNGSSNVSTYRVETRLSALREQWEKFSVTNDALGIATTQLRSRDKGKILRHRYFKDKIFKVTQELYLEAEEKIMSLLHDNSRNDRRSSSTSSLTQTSTPLSVPHYGPRLPRIDLPKFNGTPSEWLPFKDLFDSLVLSNPVLSSVEKLQYLKTSVTGSAASLLKNTTLTADNFNKAWEALVSFYENKRLLVNSALYSLLNLKRMTKESGSEIEQLYTNIMQIYRTLETLQRPIDTWDDFLVFITVQRLDSESVKAWEQHLGSSKDPPTWKQLTEFPMTRMLSLQAFEKSRYGRLNSQPYQHAKTHCADQDASRQSGSSNTCPICSEGHWIVRCPQFDNKTVDKRVELVTKKQLCYNCLGQHRASTCPSTRRCQKCGKKHHSMIHQAKPSKPDASTSVTAPAISQVNHAAKDNKRSFSFTLLATAQVVVISEEGEKAKARALIDPGSQLSFISEHLAQHLHLRRQQSSTRVHGIGAVKAGRTKGIVSVTLTSHFKSSAQCTLNAHVLPKLTSTIPTVRANKRSWPHLEGLTLADPNYNIPGRIDVLIGSDFYGQIIEEDLKKGAKNEPIARRTIFGWIISGSLTTPSSPDNVQGFHTSVDTEFQDLLQKFWHLEEIPSYNKSKLSSADQQCEDHFKSTYSRDSTGRYIVRLPLKQSADKLGDSLPNARRMLYSLDRKFKANPDYHKTYCEFLNEYEALGHMNRVLPSKWEPKHVYYLPHHGVIRESSLTTKLRVVFNGSSQTSSGISLNDILHTGAKL